MSVMSINGVELAYDEVGDGPPLLLIHAGIADRRMWDDVLPDLSRRFRTIRFDLRGYGETPLPDGPFVYAADAAELLRALDAVPASVIGVSMGGGVALDLAMAHPELVDRLVLIAPGIGGWEWGEGMDAFDAAESAAVEAGDLDAASWLNVRFWLDGASRTPDELDAALRQRVFDMQRRAFDMDNPAAEGGWLVPDRHLRLRDVDHATLLLVGALDQPDFVQIARHMSERMPRARMQMLPGVAHLPPMEDPAGFLAAIREHLSS